MRWSLRELGLPAGTRGTMVTVGTFDGFHQGHRAVVERLVVAAREAGLPSVLLTFDPHPLQIVRPEHAPPLLTPGVERLEVLADAGIDRVAVMPFNRELSRLSAEEFVDKVLIGTLGMAELLIGHDHGFGRGRTGDADTLRLIGAQRGFGVEVVPPVLDAVHGPVSSTLVRRLVQEGELAGVAELTGRPYGVLGTVVAGSGRGRTLGFRTLNISLRDHRKLLPPLGVYAVRAWTPEGPFGGMLNYGARPTFGDDQVGLEAHLFDVDRDWYGSLVRLEFLHRLRDVRRFSDGDALRRQLAEDEMEARAALTRFSTSGNLNSSALS